MTNRTIQIGIDLGTTNSEAAISNGSVSIVKNMFGDEYTPSVFGIDKLKNRIVGKRAYERLFKDASEDEMVNNKAEVKRLMGTSETVYFKRIDQSLTPEEISSEILKSLKEDILRKSPNFNVQATVITIPAYFSTLQAEATKRAGVLAGFNYVVLLQEPIAAAIAYGFMNTADESWMVFDLGGGTFDVALISSKDGALTVLSHNGDNFLGGKDFDWLIVDNVIVPKIIEQYHIKDFNRGNAKYRGVFAKLKYAAETAKIYLSQYDKTVIEIEGIGNDENGKEIFISFEFIRKDFEALIKPIIDRSIALTQETIKDSGIKQSVISKIVFVGGPTQIPYIKSRLEREFKIAIDTSVDPLTVVARGACIFAGSQKIPDEVLNKNKVIKSNETKLLRLNYESLTSESDEAISGVIDELKDNEGDYFIQISSDSGFYTGSKLKLKNGKFFETVRLETRKANLFWVYLFDSNGNSIPLEPDSFSIAHGLSVSGAPIPHSIGVAIAKRDFKSAFNLTEVFEPFFEKNSILPLKRSKTYKTVKRLKRGDTENVLPVKIYEGESEIPDRNQLICDLKITGENLPYDLPEGTEIEVTIEVNESREVKIEAFIPTIDLTLNARASVYAESVDLKKMETELQSQIERKKSIEATFSDTEKNKLNDLVQSLSVSLRNASSDEDEKRKADKQLKDLKVSLDGLEKEKEMPQLIADFNSMTTDAEKAIEEVGDEKERPIHTDQLKSLKEEGKKAIDANDKYLLKRVNEQLKELNIKILFSNPAIWVYKFQQIVEGGHSFISKKEADYYISKGEKAIELGDIEELKRCVHSLILLLPASEQRSLRTDVSGITH